MLEEHEAGGRERSVDEHMFILGDPDSPAATFRLQLFTGPDRQPVAVATQADGDWGRSLTNWAEQYAAAVWRQCFAEHEHPPIWIQREFLSGDTCCGYELVAFTVDDQYVLTEPRWRRIPEDELVRFVGAPIDPDRGTGFVPRPPEPKQQLCYEPAWLVLFPRPNPFREHECMPVGTPWWRRLGRQLVPRRAGRTCCWYHRGDWHRVCKMAIRLLDQAKRQDIAPDETRNYVLRHPDVGALSAWEQDALGTLFCQVDAIKLNSPAKRWQRRSYINGQHRTQAMLDAGVHRTVVVRYEYPSSAP
jgi:hypothetical protein